MAFADASTITLDGARKTRGNLTSARIRFMILGLGLVFAIFCARLIQLGNVEVDDSIEGQQRDAITATRPAILDANGLEMAVDIRVPSLYADPSAMVDVDEAITKLRTVLPDLDAARLKDLFSRDKKFVWVARELTPTQKDKIMGLGIPGLAFLQESKRFYPGGTEASHVLGTVNIDNQGIAGLEAHLDQKDVALLQSLGLARARNLSPTQVTIDMRVQNVLHEQLTDALQRYQAIAAAGVMLNAKTGEIVGLVSLPDFDPNDPASVDATWMGKKNQRFNRITLGRYELGSTFKTVTMAAALDSGLVKLNDTFDARYGVRFGRYTITDFHGQHRILSVPEIYKYSSNVGTIHVMQTLGKENFRSFITRAGFDRPLSVELPETIESNIPKEFSDVGAATASFGHGLSVTPLHMAQAMAAFVNGGHYVEATLLPRTEAQAKQMYHQVIKPETSEKIRYLMRLNAVDGSGSHANRIADGYRIGGKTGTAEKVVNGKYDSSKVLSVFASAFPMDDPQYVMVILIDEPKPENPQSGHTAGWNAGEVSGRIVQRVSPMLGINPDFDQSLDNDLVPPILRATSEE